MGEGDLRSRSPSRDQEARGQTTTGPSYGMQSLPCTPGALGLAPSGKGREWAGFSLTGALGLCVPFGPRKSFLIFHHPSFSQDMASLSY